MASRQSRSAETARRPVSRSGMYVYGNTVHQAETMPRRREQRREEVRRPKKVSRQVQRNRRQALHMNPAYVLFLTMAAVAALFACVWYLQMRSQLMERSAHITELQQELAEMKEENTTRYNSIMDSVNLEEVRDKATGELGMVYAGSDQIITYQNPISDYVKQFQNIPKSGILPQSDRVK